MPIAEIRHNMSGRRIVQVTAVDVTSPLLSIEKIDYSRTLWKTMRDVLSGHPAKCDRDTVLDTVAPYGWQLVTPTGPDSQVMDVQPTHVCPKCDEYLSVSLLPSDRLLWLRCRVCQWMGHDWDDAKVYDENEVL
jgi:hypothetical protein